MTENVIVITATDTISIKPLEVADGSMLRGLQEIVNGHIAVANTFPNAIHGLPPDLILVVNDEGLIREASNYNFVGSMMAVDTIFGDIAICSSGMRDGEPDIVGFAQNEAEIIFRKLLDEFECLEERSTPNEQ